MEYFGKYQLRSYHQPSFENVFCENYYRWHNSNQLIFRMSSFTNNTELQKWDF